MDDKDDEILMTSVREGELDQLSLLFERYSGILYSFFFKRVQDHALSEDLTQEVFLRILRYRHTFKPNGGGSFRSWLFSIARNIQARQWSRRFAKIHVLKEDLPRPETIELVDENKHPDDKAELTEETQLLYDALESMPDDKRQLVIMRRIQDLSYAEMSANLGCEINTLKVRVHRAVADLASRLKTLMKEKNYELPRM